MTTEIQELVPVDLLEIVILEDNYSDLLLENADHVTRAPKAKDGKVFSDTLLAEHGLSMLVRATRGNRTREVLFDAGYSPLGVPHNLDLLGISLDGVEAVVLSHGHMDHTGSLPSLLERIPRPVPLIFHPDALLDPRFVEPPGKPRMIFPRTLDPEGLTALGTDIRENASPLLVADGTVLVTGQVPRVTDFEQRAHHRFIVRNGNQEKDEILDDQSLVLHVREKGLVIVAGCSHAGIVNTIRYAMEITGVDRLHGVLGGFHLGDDTSGELTGKTIDAIQALEPDFIMPMHCTGWNAVNRIQEAFKGAFALSSVGTTVTFQGGLS